MSRLWSLLCCLVLSASLAFYGSGSVAAPAADGSITVVLCVDGGSKTLTLDAEGNPVDPAQECCDCMSCCHAVGGDLPRRAGAGPMIFSVQGVHWAAPASDAVLSTINTRHLPRGPPAATCCVQPSLTGADQAKARNFRILPGPFREGCGSSAQTGGRPFKDATA